MKGRWVFKDGQCIPANEFYAQANQGKARSDLPMPHVISDGMDVTWNPANGLLYDSKSAYTQAVKSAGCEIVGNEALPEKAPYKPEGIGQDVKTAIEQVEAGKPAQDITKSDWDSLIP